jgi:uncharacterized protein YjbI with pentapeptide repeats
MKSHREFLIQYPKESSDEARLALAAEFGFLRDGRVFWDGIPFGIRPGTDISRFHIRGVSFDNTRLTDCISTGAIFEGCEFQQGSIEASPGRKVCWDGVVFRSCRFHETTFGPATLSLHRASFESSSLRYVRFRFGRLSDACFDHALLHECSFRSAVLTNATFRRADLRKVSFERTPLTGVDFTGAQFHQMDFYGPLDLTVCRAQPANA